MNQKARLEIFQAQTANVRRLECAVSHVRRAIHHAMRKHDQPAEEAHSLVYALLYCAWLEAFFSKLIHTPYGFSIEEIEQISDKQDRHGIHEAWCKCVELGLQRVQGSRLGDIANMRKKLLEFIAAYVLEPAVLRNKIAHGQWQVALNRERTGVNEQITAELAHLDIITTDKRRLVAARLASIVEALIDSPKRHFRKAYWDELTHLEQEAKDFDSWTRESRMGSLAHKPLRGQKKAAKFKAESGNGPI